MQNRFVHLAIEITVQDIALIISNYNCQANHYNFRVKWVLRAQPVQSGKAANMRRVPT